LQKVLDDPTFNTKSPTAVDARRAAVHMLQWCKHTDNIVVLQKFTEQVMRDLRGALVTPTGKGLRRDKLWESYYHIRTTEAFTNRWTVFLCKANSPCGTPVLYQHLTDLLFKALLKFTYSVADGTLKQPSPLTNNEANALRYVAGYVCRHLRKKIEASAAPLKEEMVLCLMSMVKDKSDTSSGNCEEWTDLVDRGGLWHVRENTYSFFLSLEEEMRILLPSLLTEEKNKERIIKELVLSEDVQFYWLIVGADFDEDDQDVHRELLRRIVELFVTIRGFSYASAWLEKYKQESKKGTQKSKSLRKKLS